MSDTWINIHYIGFHKIIVEGSFDGQEFEFELTKEQKEKLYDFNYEQRQREIDFFKGLFNV